MTSSTETPPPPLKKFRSLLTWKWSGKNFFFIFEHGCADRVAIYDSTFLIFCFKPNDISTQEFGPSAVISNALLPCAKFLPFLHSAWLLKFIFSFFGCRQVLFECPREERSGRGLTGGHHQPHYQAVHVIVVEFLVGQVRGRAPCQDGNLRQTHHKDRHGDPLLQQITRAELDSPEHHHTVLRRSRVSGKISTIVFSFLLPPPTLKSFLTYRVKFE